MNLKIFLLLIKCIFYVKYFVYVNIIHYFFNFKTIMIEWMELKPYLAPTFMKEIDTVSEIYMSK